VIIQYFNAVSLRCSIAVILYNKTSVKKPQPNNNQPHPRPRKKKKKDY